LKDEDPQLGRIGLSNALAVERVTAVKGDLPRKQGGVEEIET